MPASLLRVLTGLLTCLLVAAPTSASAVPPSPLVWDHAVPDPSVVRGGPGYVVVATGALAYRRQSPDGLTWAETTPALAYLPAWAVSGDLWASDLAKIQGKWVLYYAAPVLGLGRMGRCIGVAVAASPVDPFVPVGDRPLVCPGRALTPRAHDTVDGGRGLPKLGAIDPSLHVEGRKRYLLYKVDGVPSEIRMVQLKPSGLALAGKGRSKGHSRTLLRADQVVENPVIVKRKRTYYLFTSVGYFGDCGYQTVWRKSRSLTKWKGRPQKLLTRHRTGLCGPGGADIVTSGRAALVYFAAWTCGLTPLPCAADFRAHEAEVPALRALYGARLRFNRRGRPVVDKWLVGIQAPRRSREHLRGQRGDSDRAGARGERLDRDRKGEKTESRRSRRSPGQPASRDERRHDRSGPHRAGARKADADRSGPSKAAKSTKAGKAGKAGKTTRRAGQHTRRKDVARHDRDRSRPRDRAGRRDGSRPGRSHR